MDLFKLFSPETFLSLQKTNHLTRLLPVAFNASIREAVGMVRAATTISGCRTVRQSMRRSTLQGTIRRSAQRSVRRSVLVSFAATLAISILLATSSVFSVGYALPVAFERSYRNNAWVYQNFGCFVDEQRNIYTFDESKTDPFKVIGRVPTHEYLQGLALLRDLATTPFIHGIGAMDAGVLTWNGYHEGEPILLKKAGDISTKRDSPQLPAMIELINSWCPKSLLPSLPE